MQNIHPLFVHFPIALLSVGVLFSILGIIFKKSSLQNAAWWCQLFGTVAIIAAVITGLIAESTVKHSDKVHEILESHELFGLIAAGLFVVIFIWRSILKTDLPKTLSYLLIYLVISISAVGIMFYGAHLGGIMVYEYGVGGSAVKQSKHQHNDKSHHNLDKKRRNHDKKRHNHDKKRHDHDKKHKH